MLYVGAGVNAVVATLAPVTTAALSHLLGRHISMISWAGVGVACSGFASLLRKEEEAYPTLFLLSLLIWITLFSCPCDDFRACALFKEAEGQAMKLFSKGKQEPSRKDVERYVLNFVS